MYVLMYPEKNLYELSALSFKNINFVEQFKME